MFAASLAMLQQQRQNFNLHKSSNFLRHTPQITPQLQLCKQTSQHTDDKTTQLTASTMAPRRKTKQVKEVERELNEEELADREQQIQARVLTAMTEERGLSPLAEYYEALECAKIAMDAMDRMLGLDLGGDVEPENIIKMRQVGKSLREIEKNIKSEVEQTEKDIIEEVEGGEWPKNWVPPPGVKRGRLVDRLE